MLRRIYKELDNRKWEGIITDHFLIKIITRPEPDMLTGDKISCDIEIKKEETEGYLCMSWGHGKTKREALHNAVQDLRNQKAKLQEVLR